MTVLDIKLYPDPILTSKSEDIPFIKINTEEIHQLIRDMIDTVNFHNAVGLAAPQIGVSKSIIIYTDDKGRLDVIINPAIVFQSGNAMSYKEGCISVPSVRKDIKRFRKVLVSGFDPKTNAVSVKPRHKQSVFILQHEIDHLNGITIMERGK